METTVTVNPFDAKIEEVNTELEVLELEALELAAKRKEFRAKKAHLEKLKEQAIELGIY